MGAARGRDPRAARPDRRLGYDGDCRGSGSRPSRSTPSRPRTPSPTPPSLGYDAVEVMVGIDALSQQTSAVKQLSEHHGDPGLRRARAVPAVHPAGLGHRAVGQARALRGDGARGRRRGGRRAPAVPLAEGVRRATSSTASRRSRSRPASPSRSRTCIRGGPPAGGWRCTCPAGTPPPSPTPTPRSTSRTPRSPTSDLIEMADRLGDRLRHIHLTDGTGSAKDEHLVPGRGTMGAAASCATWPRPASAARSCSRSTPASAPTGPSASATCASRWSSPASTSRWAPSLRAAPDGAVDRSAGARRRRAGGPAAPTPAPRSSPRRASCSPRRASPVRRCARSPPHAGRRRGAGAPLLRHQGRPVPRRAGAARSTRARRCSPVVDGGVDGAGERLMRRVPLGLGRRGDPAAAARRWSAASSTRRASSWSATASCRMVLAPVGAALELDQPERRMPLVASQLVGLVVIRYVLAVEPLASAAGRRAGRDVRARRCSATCRAAAVGAGITR